jgi:hypothetical protein
MGELELVLLDLPDHLHILYTSEFPIIYKRVPHQTLAVFKEEGLDEGMYVYYT